MAVLRRRVLTVSHLTCSEEGSGGGGVPVVGLTVSRSRARPSVLTCTVQKIYAVN